MVEYIYIYIYIFIQKNFMYNNEGSYNHGKWNTI